MIFIDTVNRLRQLPERDDTVFQRRRRTVNSNDSLTLSEAATYVQHITLTADAAFELTPVDSIIANILETLLEQFENQKLDVTALSQLAANQEDWELPLQTPPLEQAKDSPTDYTEHLKAQHKKGIEKRFEFTLVGKSNQQRKLMLLFRIQHLNTSAVQRLQGIPPNQQLTTPYSIEQLQSLPEHWTFEMDQDGEQQPLSSLYNNVSTRATYTISVPGLQIWYEKERDALPLLIADPNFGYVYIGNYGTGSTASERQSPTIHHEGDIDTSA